MGEIAAKLALSQSSTSKHLKTLKNVGLVAVRIDAQSRLYSLDLAGLRVLDEWLTPYRKLWANRLDALERHLDAASAGHSTNGKGKSKKR